MFASCREEWALWLVEPRSRGAPTSGRESNKRIRSQTKARNLPRKGVAVAADEARNGRRARLRPHNNIPQIPRPNRKRPPMRANPRFRGIKSPRFTARVGPAEGKLNMPISGGVYVTLHENLYFHWNAFAININSMGCYLWIFIKFGNPSPLPNDSLLKLDSSRWLLHYCSHTVSKIHLVGREGIPS